MGIEPTAQAWEAWVLPLYDARDRLDSSRVPQGRQIGARRGPGLYPSLGAVKLCVNVYVDEPFIERSRRLTRGCPGAGLPSLTPVAVTGVGEMKPDSSHVRFPLIVAARVNDASRH